MYGNQTRRWHFVLAPVSVLFCIMIGYALDVKPSQASTSSTVYRSVTDDVAPTVPTVPATATEVPTVPPTVTPVPTIPTVIPTVPAVENFILVSASKSGKVDGIKFRDEDILAYDRVMDSWSIVVDGSDVGLNRLDLTDFYIMADGSILMNFNHAFTIPGLGKVDDSDIVRFTPTQLGSETQGSFAWYVDGSDVGLTKGGEDIDAIAFDLAGNLVVSTKGSFRIDDLRGKDEDLFVFKSTDLGQETAGAWELYLDGSQIGLTRGNEDIDGTWIDQAGNLYLTTKGDFMAEGSTGSIQGDGNDIFICIPTTLGANTDCTFQPFFDGDAARFTRRFDGIALGNIGALAPLWPNPSSINADDSQVEEAQYALLEDDEVEATATDEEIDLYDQEGEEEEDGAIQRVLFLPLINTR